MSVCMCDIEDLLEVDEVSPSLPVLCPTAAEHRVKRVVSTQQYLRRQPV